MSEGVDDLEQTLVLAAAEADSLQYVEETEEPKTIEIAEINKTQENKKIRNLENGESPTKKCKTQEYEETKHNKPQTSNFPHAHVVATHYNQLEEKGLQERSKSRIIYMRNFHNWIKSMLINEYLTKIKDSKKQHNPPIRVHDMCCGKGGDLLKWKIGNITHLICSDIAEVSLECCRARYDDMKNRTQNKRGTGNIFSLEIIDGDCTKVRLRERYSDPSMKLDLVSCQFAFHYSFESLPQAEGMLRNASECLQPGGYFIGTIADSNEIIARARKSKTGRFGNKIVQVKVNFDLDKPPLFGAKYNFKLDEAVDCPEFLVHFPTFVKLAKKFGLKLVRKEKFLDFFMRMKDEGRELLTNMRALEGYPPNEKASLLGNSEDYLHAKNYIERYPSERGRIGTLSRSEWEASCEEYLECRWDALL